MKNRIIENSLKTTVKEKPFSIILLFIAIILGIFMQLVPPQILKNIIDNNISKGIYQGIWKLSYYYLIAVLISGFADFIREFMMADIGQDILLNIRYNMGKKLSYLPISYFSNNPIGQVISRFTSDVDAVGSLFTSGIIGMIADSLKAVGIIVSIYLLSPVLSLYVFLLIPILYFIAKFFKNSTLKAQIETRKAVGNINGFIQELFNGIRTVKIFGMEKHFISDFQQPLNENINAVHKTSIFDSVFPCLMQIIRALIISITVIIAAPKGLGALGISIGAIAAVIDLISRILAPIESIAMEFQTIQEAVAGVKRIQSFASEDEEKRYSDDAAIIKKYENLSISVNNVAFSYSKDDEIIKNISFAVEPGQKTVLVGRTGAGKSTILNLIAGLYKPDEGSIEIGGMDPFKMNPNIRRRIMGIVPQSFPVYDVSVRDAVTLYDETISEEQVEEAARIVGLHDDIIKLPNGYNTIIGEGETGLSNGQYQLLSLACALVLNPPILLLDEVTSGLDGVTEERVFKALKNISKGRTIITISHRVSGIIDADKVIILDSGKIVEEGTPIDLAGKNGWYAKYSQIEQLGWKI
ncbi:MAG: ABC transporter ATP-binding protein/permease [Bacillota bacterium]|nr:ABC transporter ATP-binding protein/permease [Bacillota bacterium]